MVNIYVLYLFMFHHGYFQDGYLFDNIFIHLIPHGKPLFYSCHFMRIQRQIYMIQHNSITLSCLMCLLCKFTPSLFDKYIQSVRF